MSSFPVEEVFLSRLLETGATESCSDVLSSSQIDEGVRTSQATTRNVLQNILTSINYLWHASDQAISALCKTLPVDGKTYGFTLYFHDIFYYLMAVHGFYVAQTIPSIFTEFNSQLQMAATDLRMEVWSFQVAIRDLHLKHRPLANEVRQHRDMDAKNKAEHKRLAGIFSIGCKMIF